MNDVDRRLQELGITLPDAPLPAANYVPAVIAGSMLFVAGQVPLEGGKVVHVGKVGQDVSLEVGIAAAKLCALNILAQARAALDGDLGRIVRCAKVQGFVNCAPDFTDHPKVVNGASDLLVAVLGDAGRHARFAVGAPSLPLGAAVEVDATFLLG